MQLLNAALPLLQAGTETQAETIDWKDPQALLAAALPYAADFGLKLLAAVAVFFVGRWIAGLLTGAVRRVLLRGKLDEGVARFLSSLVYMVLLTLVVIAAVSNLGVKTTSFVAIIGAAGLAIGLALQGSLANFAAGVLIMVFRPFKVGDWVEAGGHAGTIEEVQVFATMMRTGDNKLIILPNGAVTGGSIVNYSAKPTRRIDLVVGIGYDDDIRKAKQVLERVVQAEPRVLADPAPTIAVSELGESSVNLVVRPWVQGSEYWPTRFALIEAIKLELDREGITIPFPQRDVHMHQVA